MPPPPPLLTASSVLHAWLHKGGDRPPMRVAFIRYWQRHRLLRAPVPLTGPRALGAGVAFAPETWMPCFLEALADEAADYPQLLFDLERGWFAARLAVAGRPSTSRAAEAIDLMAAASLASATTLAGRLGMAVKNATALLDSSPRGDRRRSDASVEAAFVRPGGPGAAARAGAADAAAGAGAGQGAPADPSVGCGAATANASGPPDVTAGAAGLRLTAISRRGWRTRTRRSGRPGTREQDRLRAGESGHDPPARSDKDVLSIADAEGMRSRKTY